VDLPSGRLYAGSILLSPVAVLGGAFLIEGLLLQPLVAPFIALFVLIALAATVGRDWAIFSRVFAGVVGVVWLLYAVDLARLLRRQRAA
jgi:hypothetical protein